MMFSIKMQIGQWFSFDLLNIG